MTKGPKNTHPNHPPQGGNAPELLRNSEFLLGAADPKQFPQDDAVEIAFAGRSNVGKSSAINAIAGRRKLARTSKTPGRTQQINFFSLGDSARLVDLPGYGFAQVPLAVKAKWQQMIHTYLTERSNLLVLVLLMDIRHPLTELDLQMVHWASEAELATQVLLTKADKLTRGKTASTVLTIERELAKFGGNFGVEPFSAHSRLGVSAIQKEILQWVAADK